MIYSCIFDKEWVFSRLRRGKSQLAHLQKHIVLRYKNREVSGKVDKNGGGIWGLRGEVRKFRGLGVLLRNYFGYPQMAQIDADD
ncbi:hypothetical protein DFO77_1382 [Marinilabilia salmonicolor]|uniref:Uncharacterized protein n=1 Tax=Marinilabilia salmonicolor TaxID=989 RepID=A0A368UJ59_9BACT|nr:hypothetical protein DFO77_1382 [Marinilabilia salmonicolor]